MSSDFDEDVSAITRQYAAFRDDGRLGDQAAWSWYDPATADLRVQQWLSFLSFLRSQGISLAGKRLLDVGCGDGRWLRAALDLGVMPEDCFGVEVIDWRLDAARKLSPTINWQLMNGSQLPFADESFDLVAQSLVFSSISNPALRDALAAEMGRVTRRGGFIYWFDLPHTVLDDGAQRLSPNDLFSGWPVRSEGVACRPPPSSSLRPLRGMRKLIGPLLDTLKHHPSHVSAILGPKA